VNADLKITAHLEPDRSAAKVIEIVMKRRAFIAWIVADEAHFQRDSPSIPRNQSRPRLSRPFQAWLAIRDAGGCFRHPAFAAHHCSLWVIGRK
jgi:hypothetical protein